MKNNKYISVIIPTPEIESLIQEYRFKYDFFAKRGIPSHITFIYEISTDVYNKNSELLLKAFTQILNILNKSTICAEKIKKNENMLAINFRKEDINLINKLQKIIIGQCGLNITDNRYEKNDYKPHITIFTGKKNLGWKNEKIIKNDILNDLPIKITIKTLWILEINTSNNTAKIIKTIRI